MAERYLHTIEVLGSIPSAPTTLVGSLPAEVPLGGTKEGIPATRTNFIHH